jgi:hypothetical protein
MRACVDERIRGNFMGEKLEVVKGEEILQLKFKRAQINHIKIKKNKELKKKS